MKKLIPLFFIFFLSACAADRQYDNYRMSLSDLTLTSTNHLHGYTKSDCFTCHQPQNIHQVDRLGAGSFPLAKQLVNQSGLASCSGCHGTNGVP